MNRNKIDTIWYTWNLEYRLERIEWFNIVATGTIVLFWFGCVDSLLINGHLKIYSDSEFITSHAFDFNVYENLFHGSILLT